MTYLYLALTVFGASFLQSIIGFGFPVLAVPVLSLFFPYTKVLAMVLAISFVSTFYLSVKYRKSTNWKVMLPILIPCCISGAVATYFSFSISSDAMFILLGLMLVAIALFSLFFAERIKIKPTPLNGTIVGIICGLSNGLFSIVGPPAALYMIPATNSKEEYLGTGQTCFTICNVASLSIRLFRGAIEGPDMKYLALGWFCMLTGAMVGQLGFKKINAKLFNKIVYIFVGLNGLWIFISHII